MTPKSFAALAVAAAVSTFAAAVLYTSSVEWSRQSRGGIPLFAELRDKASDVAVIEVEQGDKKIAVKRQGEEWVLGNHDSFPASKEKVQRLLAALRRADLVEPKTRKPDRFALLGVEDPKAKDAKSNSVRLLDAQGEAIAGAIIGNRRPDAFGMGRGGTYVRKSGDEQAWLANAEIGAGTGLENWVEPQLFATRSEGVKRIELAIPGEEPLKIERDRERSGHTLAEIPDGMKLKYLNIVDNIVSAATTLEFTDVRKRRETSADDEVSSVAMELEGGLKVDVQLREKDGATWMTLSAIGEGEAKKVAEDLVARAKGWEFRISESRVKEILKRRDDLLERVSS